MEEIVIEETPCKISLKKIYDFANYSGGKEQGPRGRETRVIREGWKIEEAFQAEGRTDANVTKYGKAWLSGSSVQFHRGWEGRREPGRSGR